MNIYEDGIDYEGVILIVFSVLLVFCLDVVRVVLGCVCCGKDFFMLDKIYIYYKFFVMGFILCKVMIFIFCILFFFCLINIILVSYIDNMILFFCDVVVWILMNFYMDKIILCYNKLGI